MPGSTVQTFTDSQIRELQMLDPGEFPPPEEDDKRRWKKARLPRPTGKSKSALMRIEAVELDVLLEHLRAFHAYMQDRWDEEKRDKVLDAYNRAITFYE